jgi:hypothetical protein
MRGVLERRFLLLMQYRDSVQVAPSSKNKTHEWFIGAESNFCPHGYEFRA